jgi:hypothetical protein
MSVYKDQQYALFVFGLLGINSLYMFPALFIHHQEALHVKQLVYICAYYVGWLLAGWEWS